MPLAASDPFGNRNVASGSVTYALPPPKPVGSQIVSGINDVVGLFKNMGEQGVRRSQAGYYDAESERARAEAGKAQSEGEAKAAAIARQQKKDSDLAEGERVYQETFKATNGNAVAAAQARQQIIAPYYADEFAEKGLTSQLATEAMLSGVDQTGGGGPPTQVQRAARDVAAGALAVNDRALKGPEGTTQLTYTDNANALAADEQRQRDKANQESGDRRYATGVESGDRRFATTTEAATSQANNIREIMQRDRVNYATAYMKSLEQIRAAGGDPRLPGGGIPASKTGDVDKTQVIYDKNHKPLRTIETTSASRARFGQGPQAPGLPQGPAYPQGPAGPSLQPAPAMAKPNMSDAAIVANAQASAQSATPAQKAQIAARLRGWNIDPTKAGF